MTKPRSLKNSTWPSGVVLAQQIREGTLTARAAVEHAIDQVRRVNPILNAVVQPRFEEALQEAEAADVRVRNHDPAALPPFLGVPCTIKECFALTGMPNTAGLVARCGGKATADATAVARLRAAGAIPIGVTNTSELCMWTESNNCVYGRTNNAYDPRRTAGGSSGGEGAIIGAGTSPFGLGSDFGGSIRIPAFFNGVFGHKPTGGLVPNTGQYPLPAPRALRYLATGPLARHAEDLMPLLRVLAGPDGKDPSCTPFQLGDPDVVRMEDLAILSIQDNGVFRVSSDLQQAQHRVVQHLTSRGAVVEHTSIQAFRRSFEIWSALISSAGGETFSELLSNRKPFHLGCEWVRWAFGRSNHTLPALGLAVLEKLPRLVPTYTQGFVELGHALREELKERLGPKGLLLYPSFLEPAPRHSKSLLFPFGWVYPAIFNVLEFPVTQIPLGLNSKGLPLGIQTAAVPGNDHMTIALALELEKAFGGWVPPPLCWQDS